MDAKALKKWAYASMIGFVLPEMNVGIWFDLFAGLGFNLPLRNYLGILNGKPAAASELFLGAGVAGIFGSHHPRGASARDWSGNDVGPSA